MSTIWFFIFGAIYSGPHNLHSEDAVLTSISALGGIKVDFGKYLVRQSIASLFFVCRNL